MHPSALYNCHDFFDTYGPSFKGRSGRVVEIGAQDVNGSVRPLAPSHFEYVGVDFVQGKGVDVLLDDPYKLPFETGSVDIVLTSSCLEHSEMFWLLYLEMIRILKSDGLLYINAPSNGEFHRYPVDCWRFYPDSGGALVNWGRRNGYGSALLESFTSEQDEDVWNDFVMVVVKDEAAASRYPKRMATTRPDISNGITYGVTEMINYQAAPEDKRKLYMIRRLLSDASPPMGQQQKLDLIKSIVNDETKSL